MSDDLVDLITQLLQLSPSRRISAKDALNHPYFDQTLVPQMAHAWFGEPRVDLSSKCVEVKDGRRLVDHLAVELQAKRVLWATREF
jgi:serine/threonine protein kinase